MMIFFEQFEVDYYLFNPPTTEQVGGSTSVPTDPVNPPTIEQVGDSTFVPIDRSATKAKFEKDNKLIRGHMLNHMINNIFDLFVKDKYAKYIWDTLEKKYGADS